VTRRPAKKRTPIHWYTVPDAAGFLSVSADGLRKRLERHAFAASDGGTEAQIDGVRGRKFGNQWRVALGPRWTE
jgi:hypothetical protein